MECRHFSLIAGLPGSVLRGINRLWFAPYSCPPELVVSGAVGDWRVPEPQRLRSEDRRDRSGIALAREDADDHVGQMDAFGYRLGAGGFDRRQSVGEHGGEDRDHMLIAIIGVGELRRTFSSAAGSTQSLNGAPLRSARGLRARTGT